MVQVTQKDRGLNSLKTDDESQDTEPEQVNPDPQGNPSALSGSTEDTGNLSEGEVFIPAKRQRTITPPTKSQKKTSPSSKERLKSKSGRPKGKWEKQHNSKSGTKEPQLLPPEPLNKKAKPINLRTAV